jgi:hypothetical protein
VKKLVLAGTAAHTIFLGWIAMRLAELAEVEPEVRPVGTSPTWVPLSVVVLMIVGSIAYGVRLAITKDR